MRGAPSAHPRWRGAGTQGRHVTSPVASGDTRSGGFAIAASPPGTSGRPGPAAWASCSGLWGCGLVSHSVEWSWVCPRVVCCGFVLWVSGVELCSDLRPRGVFPVLTYL